MKKTLIFSIIVSIIIGIVALLLIFNVNQEIDNVNNKNSVNNLETVNQLTNELIQGKGSLNSLLALTKNLECTIGYTASSSEKIISGSYFVSAGRMRGDFIVPSLSGDIVSSMIVTNDILYNWSKIEGQSYGIKMSIDQNQKIKDRLDTPDSHETVPHEAEVDYECKPWLIVDDSIFEPPSDVLFKEYDTVIEGGMEYGTVYEEPTTTKSACALCEQIPDGEGKKQCLVNFKCLE